MNHSPGRFPWTTALSVVLLLALFEYLFFVPLRPTAWGGPRGTGFFEEGELPAAGRFAREARLYIEELATWRSPDRVLDATAEGLAGYHALLAVARYGILWLVLWRIGGRGWLASLLVVGSAVPMFLGGSRQTDVDVGLLLFVVLMAATTPKRIPWWLAVGGLPALFAFWANAHASAVAGLAWLFVILVGRSIEWWQAYEEYDEDRPAMLRWFLLVPLCVGATCINPDGPRLFFDAFAIAKNPNVAALPGWRPMDFSKPAGFPWIYFGTLAALLLVQLWGRRAFTPTALLVVLSFGFWPLTQQRGQDYWWLIVPWLLAPQMASIIQRLRKRTEPEALARAEPKDLANASGSDRPRFLMVRIVLAVVLALLATPVVRWFISGRPRSLESVASRETPVRMVLELTADDEHAGQFLPDLRTTVRVSYPSGKYRGAILCGEDQGDFLSWVLDGDDTKPVMMYTRPETLDRPHWEECRRALDGNTDWWEILGRHQVNLVVIDPSRFDKLAERLRKDPEWRIVQDDGTLLTALRKEPKLPVNMMSR